jgi:linoleoyl-CoA desaturase
MQRIIRLKNAKWHNFHVFKLLLFSAFYTAVYFDWAITTDFKQMKSYLKVVLRGNKKAQILWTTLIITKVIYVSIWIVLPIVIGIVGGVLIDSLSCIIQQD